MAGAESGWHFSQILVITMQPSNFRLATDILGALICGGHSTRFGSDKRVYRVGEKSLFEISHENLNKVCHDVVCVFRDNVPHCFQKYNFIHDDLEAKGPVAGILSALSFSKKPYVLTLPCDMPSMSKDILYELCRHKSLDKISVAYSQRLEPLVAVYPKAFYEKLKRYTVEESFSLERFINALSSGEKRLIHHDKALSFKFTNLNKRPIVAPFYENWRLY